MLQRRGKNYPLTTFEASKHAIFFSDNPFLTPVLKAGLPKQAINKNLLDLEMVFGFPE